MAVFILTEEARRAAAIRTIEALPVGADPPFEVHVTTHVDKPSDAQVRYLHGVVYREIAQQAWVEGRRYAPSVWKEYFNRKFIGEGEMTLPSGRVVSQAMHSGDLGRREHTRFIEQVKRHAMEEFGVVFHEDYRGPVA